MSEKIRSAQLEFLTVLPEEVSGIALWHNDKSVVPRVIECQGLINFN